MSSSRPFFRRLAPVVLGLALACWPRPVLAEDKALQAASEGLGIFFDLGLTDTRGAKWVQARIYDGRHSGDSGLMENRSSMERREGYSGNAWLLREDKDGTVELLFNQCQRVRARRTKQFETPKAGGLPGAMISPADLANDVKVLMGALSHRPAPNMDDFDRRMRERSAGTTLLFVAHLQRQGMKPLVMKVLPDVLQMTERAQLVDLAVSCLADEQLRKASEEWVERGDTAAYLKALGALNTKFSTGWKKRAAAQQLVERLRATPTAPPNKVAELLLALKPGELEQLPFNKNWIIPGPLPADDRDDFPDPDEPKPAKPQHPVVTHLLNNKKQAATELSQLLEDHRFVRVLADNSRESSYEREDASPEEKLKNAYQQLNRPYELGELAWKLLEPVAPSDLRYSSEPRQPAINSWLGEILALNDEQLAWDQLRRSSSASDPDFIRSLGYLIENGSDDTRKQLRAVFLDPAVWRSASGEQLIPSLQAYIQRVGADPAFNDKLRDAVRTSLKREGSDSLAGLDAKTLAEYKKQEEESAKRQMKLVEQALKPQDTATLLAELATSQASDAKAILQILAPQLAKLPYAQAEAQIFQTAAQCVDEAVQRQVIMTLYRLGARSKAAGKAPLDPATLKALRSLLESAPKTAQTPPAAPPEPAEPAEEEEEDEERQEPEWANVPAMTAFALMSSRLSQEDSASLTKIGTLAPGLSAEVSKAYAMALINGQSPTLPDASKVPPAQVDALLKKLSELTAEDVFKTLQASAPDLQIALLERLEKLQDWPPALIKAQLTIRQLHGEQKLQSMLGKTLNLEVQKQLQAEVEKAATGKAPLDVKLSARGLLGGLLLNISTARQKIPLEAINQQMEIKLQKQNPVGLITVGIMSRESGPYNPTGRYMLPVWKDPALTDHWRSHPELWKAGGKADPGFTESLDPKAFNGQLEKVLTLSAEMRGSLEISWQTLLIQDTPTEP